MTLPCRYLPLALALFAQPALADNLPVPEDLGIRGEFVRAGTGFACEIKPDQKITPEIQAKLSDLACLHLGTLAIGAEEKSLDARFGKPERTMDLANHATAKIYFTAPADDASYFVITVRRHRVVAIQLTGTRSVEGYDFDRIALGSSTRAVLAHLGQPLVADRVPDTGAELWSYAPWTFSLEVTDGHVTSIRIADGSAF